MVLQARSTSSDKVSMSRIYRNNKKEINNSTDKKAMGNRHFRGNTNGQ